MKEIPFPPEITGVEEQIAYLNENTPLIFVPATLDGAWNRALSCPMVVWDREGLCHTVRTDRLGRAWYTGGERGRRVYVTRKNRGGFRREAYAVQRDLPGERPGLGAGLGRLLSGMGGFDTAALVLWSAGGGGVLLLLGELLRRMLTDAAQRPEMAAAMGDIAGVLGAVLGLLYLACAGMHMAGRISRRAALGLLPALGERMWLNPGPENPAQRAGCLASLREDGERLVRWTLTLVCGLGAGAVPAVKLAEISPGLSLTAAVTASVLLLAAVVTAAVGAGRDAGSRAGAEYRWIENRSSDKRFGVERPFPFGAKNAARGRLGLPWLALPPLMALVLFIAVREGLSLSRMAEAAVLYLPAAVFPLALLEGAGWAGRALADLRGLLHQAARGSGHDRDLPKQGSALELKNVTFTYPGRREPVLRDVDLRIFPGEVLGVAGGTGAGKTTLAGLMTGLLAPDAGQVYYGGIELGRYERESILRRIALENGEDIRLLDKAPAEPDGRTTVIFSAREEDLACCERVFDLSEGRLVLRAPKKQRL